MKGLIGLAVIGIIGVGGIWWLMAQANKDPGEPVMIALGNTHDGKVEFHVCIQMPMMKRGPLGGRGNPKDWDEWLAGHFNLRSDSGDPVPFHLAAHSNLIPDD